MIRRPPISTLLPYTTLFRCPASFKRLLGGALWLRRASLPEDPPSFRGPMFARSELNNLRSSAAGFLVKTELIPRRIGEYRKCAHACADIRTKRQNAPPCSLDPLERIGDSIHHDIGPCPFVSSPIALLDPCAAHSAGVIEGELTVPTSPDLPAENAAVEVRRRFGRLRRYLEITDLAVGHLVSNIRKAVERRLTNRA